MASLAKLARELCLKNKVCEKSGHEGKMTMMIIGNGTLITQREDLPLIENGAVVIDGELIADYGKTEDMQKAYPSAEFMDAQGRLIMPGLINAHTHIYSAMARGMSIPGAPVNKNFLDILENLWWRLDKVINMEDVKYSAYDTYLDSIKCGVTTVFDHHASMKAVEGSLFTIADVAKDIGVRTSLCYEVTDRDGEDVAKATVRENGEFIRYAQNLDSDMLKGMFGLHASFTVSDETLEACVKEMGSANAGYHVHVAEGIDDVYQCQQEHGKRVVQRLYDFDILGGKTIAVHCIHINPAEMDILQHTNTAVVHNPESNMGNAVGCSPVIEMMRRGMLVGMGTDAYTHDMFESMKMTNLLHKHSLCDPSVAWGEPPQMLFQNNRSIAGRYFSKPLGIIEKNAYADIILVDYEAPTPILPTNINSHFIFGILGGSVDTTIINGKIIMKNREFVNIDEKAIFAKSRECAKAVWDRI